MLLLLKVIKSSDIFVSHFLTTKKRLSCTFLSLEEQGFRKPNTSSECEKFEDGYRT